MSLTTQIKEILLNEEEYRGQHSLNKTHCTIKKITNGFEIEYGQMYEAPTINFETLLRLSELFGTKKIDVDNYSRRGCDTCDFGSNYGHTIQIISPTKNIEELSGLIGKDIIKL